MINVTIEEYVPLAHDPMLFSFNMAQADRKEVVQATGKPPYSVLMQSLSSSNMAWVAMSNGTPIAFMGMVIDQDNGGVPWLLSSDLAYESIPMDAFCNTTWAILDVMLKHVKFLHNYVSLDHKRAIKWLKFLGFHFDETTYILDDPDQEFHRFYMTRSSTDV